MLFFLGRYLRSSSENWSISEEALLTFGLMIMAYVFALCTVLLENYFIGKKYIDYIDFYEEEEKPKKTKKRNKSLKKESPNK